jgi:hypothetical protein
MSREASIDESNLSGDANHSANTTAIADGSRPEAQALNRTFDQIQANAAFAAAMDAFERRQHLQSLISSARSETGGDIAVRASSAASLAPDQPDGSGTITLANRTGRSHK